MAKFFGVSEEERWCFLPLLGVVSDDFPKKSISDNLFFLLFDIVLAHCLPSQPLFAVTRSISGTSFEDAVAVNTPRYKNLVNFSCHLDLRVYVII